jgi:hypothetical protein
MCKQRWSRNHVMLKKYTLHCAWPAAQRTRAIRPPAPAAAAAKPVGFRLRARAAAAASWETNFESTRSLRGQHSSGQKFGTIIWLNVVSHVGLLLRIGCVAPTCDSFFPPPPPLGPRGLHLLGGVLIAYSFLVLLRKPIQPSELGFGSRRDSAGRSGVGSRESGVGTRESGLRPRIYIPSDDSSESSLPTRCESHHPFFFFC